MGKPLILLDPGHGGADPGAVAPCGVTEANLNLAIAILTRSYLAQVGLQVGMTREGDDSLSLSDRVRLANSNPRPALFVSIHCNAAANTSAAGREVWTSPGQTAADSAATRICERLRVNRADWIDGDPDREENFYVLKKTVCPAVLVECGFVTNPADLQRLRSHEGRAEIAAAIAGGVLDWLGISQG